MKYKLTKRMKKILISIAALMVYIVSMAQVNLNDGLILYYPFTGDMQDLSGNSNNGIVSGTPVLCPDRRGTPESAFSFGGNGSFIQGADINGLPQLADGAGQYTVCAWMLAKDNSRVVVGNNSTDGWFYLMPTWFYLRLDDWTGEGVSTGNESIDSLNWHFVAGIVDFPDIKLYYDGAFVDTATIVGHSLLIAGMANGGVKIGSDYDNRYFKGNIDEVRIYNRALNTDEMNALFSVSRTVDTAVYYVSSPDFSGKSPMIFQTGSDTLPSQDIVRHYSKFEFKPYYYTDTIFVSVEDTLNFNVVITEMPANQNLVAVSVYPNPAHEFLTIRFDEFEKLDGYSLHILNESGILMYSSSITNQQYTLNVSEWTGKGLYFLTISDSNGTVISSKKIILE
jgi:hypothetical protein